MLSLGSTHGGSTPWDASRIAPKGDESPLILAGSPKELETVTAVAALPVLEEEEKGHCSEHSSLPSAPLSFRPPSRIFYMLASCLVMKFTFLLENAVCLLRSLLEAILKQMV